MFNSRTFTKNKKEEKIPIQSELSVNVRMKFDIDK